MQKDTYSIFTFNGGKTEFICQQLLRHQESSFVFPENYTADMVTGPQRISIIMPFAVYGEYYGGRDFLNLILMQESKDRAYSLISAETSSVGGECSVVITLYVPDGKIVRLLKTIPEDEEIKTSQVADLRLLVTGSSIEITEFSWYLCPVGESTLGNTLDIAGTVPDQESQEPFSLPPGAIQEEPKVSLDTFMNSKASPPGVYCPPGYAPLISGDYQVSDFKRKEYDYVETSRQARISYSFLMSPKKLVEARKNWNKEVTLPYK